MDLSHLLDIAAGLVVAWIASLEVRTHIANSKLAKYEQKEKDSAIVTDTEAESDSAIDSDMAKHLPPG